MDAYNPHETEKRSEHEEILSHLLTQACEQIYPTSGFSLQLDGVQPTLLVKNELEAFLGHELSEETGATITLGYNIETDNLELQTLSQPLKDIPRASFSILRTLDTREELQYIPVIQIDNHKHNLARTAYGRTLNDTLLRSFLSGYHLSNIPHPDHDSYQLWRANLLSNCEDGWHVREQMTLLAGMSDTTEESITVNREVHYINDGDTLSKEELIHTNTFSSLESTTTQSVSTQLVEEADRFGRQLHAYKQVRTNDFHPFVANYSVTTKESTEVLPVDEKTSSSFTRIGATVNDILRARD